MENFDTKINTIKKSLTNIRGYLWEQQDRIKTPGTRRYFFQERFLERQKKS
jgi:hypothetical protein